MRILLAIALALFTLAPAEVALADAIRIPTCPRGWRGRRVGHGGFCFPVGCTSDAQCGDDGRCLPVARCWTERRRPAGRRPTDDMVWMPEQRECAPDGSCPQGECRRARECVYGDRAGLATEPPPTSEPNPTSSSAPPVQAQVASPNTPAQAALARGGCGVLGARSASPLLLALGGAFALRILRRRR